MRKFVAATIVMIAMAMAVGSARQPAASGPYKVLKMARVGGEGGWDYIFADSGARRLYIPRGAVREAAATDTTPAVAAVPARIIAYNLDTIEKVGEILDTGGNGVATCPNTGHGFSSSRPAITMFDTKELKLIKKIDYPEGFGPDGIYCDTFNDRVYVFSHPTKNALAIDAKDGTVAGTVDLAGTPEQAVSDGKGTLYVVMQAESNIAVVDVKTMKTTAHYDFAEKGGRCNGLALDAKNSVLFVACANSSMTPAQGATPQPTMVIMSAKDGKILTTLPLAGGSDGAVFNPDTMEAFSTHGNGTLTVVKETSPTKFEVLQNLDTKQGARTVTLDSKTGRIFTMADERTPPPPPPPGTPAGRGGRGTVVPGSFTILMIGK
jgi:DNA-binding beta-propeller fold protein YncE